METELINGNPSTSNMDQELLCQFFLKGSCSFGSNCRNVHANSHDDSHEPCGGSSSVNFDTNQNISANKEMSGTKTKLDPLKWINAPEFVPKFKSTITTSTPEPNQVLSYAEIVTLHNNHSSYGLIEEIRTDSSLLCPYIENSGTCPHLENCTYQHGELCELCGKYCLHPTDAEQRRLHNAECIKQHEADMEHSFAIQRSKDKVCGICLEIILEKPGREQRFGILPNCNHIFCLECIRTWRKAKNFENKIKRGCPTCRTASDFVCPSMIWVEAHEEKDKLINDYKKACNTTHCKHFKQGAGKCPFGNKCFYKHALPNGQLIDVGCPSRQPFNRRISSEITQLQDFFRQVIHQRDRLLDDFVASFFSDSDDSDLSELYDFYD